jgi:hypothetical protein
MNHKEIVKRLIEIQVPYWVLRWIISFLSGRLQTVIIHGIISDITRILVGSAQGEVMSGDLLKCLTDHIRINHPDIMLLKFADDKFILSRVSDRADFDRYQAAATSVVKQLNALDLQINDTKTKELVIDFTVNQRITNSLPFTWVLGRQVERVDSLRMVGYHLNSKLSSSNHVDFLSKKANSKLFLLYKMVAMRFPKDMLLPFYHGVVRSPLEFAAPAFHFKLTEKESKTIERIQKRALKAINRADHQISDRMSASDMTNTITLADRRSDICDAFFEKLISQGCPIIPPINSIRNGKMISQDIIHTQRYQKTFFPSQIEVFNAQNLSNPETKRAQACYTKH